MSNLSYAILGTGALGGFYGARLQKAGVDAHFLLNSDREHVKKHGLVIESVDGDFTLPHVRAYGDVSEMPRCDVVAVTMKTTQNHLLPKMLPYVVKDDGVVLVLQNGMGVEEEVAEIVGPDRVMGGLCFICSNKVGPGYIRHLGYLAITLGEYASNYQACGITERMRQIAADFESAGIPITLSEDLLRARWEKLVWNIPFNGLSVVLDATTNQIMTNAYTRALVEELMREVVAGAAACDRILSQDIIDKMIDHTDKMKPYRTSMKIDYDEGRPLEVETMFANPLRKAQTGGAHLARISMLYQQLKFLDSAR